MNELLKSLNTQWEFELKTAHKLLRPMREYKNYFKEIIDTIDFTRQKIIEDKTKIMNSPKTWIKRCRSEERLKMLMEQVEETTTGLIDFLNKKIDEIILISQI